MARMSLCIPTTIQLEGWTRHGPLETITTPYVRPSQPQPEAAPVGFAAIRQLNGEPSVGVVNFSRDIAPGTSVENLTLQTVTVINSGVGVLAPLSRLATQAAPVVG